MIDINKIDRMRANSVYKLNDYRVIVWHPSWLVDIIGLNNKK